MCKYIFLEDTIQSTTSLKSKSLGSVIASPAQHFPTTGLSERSLGETRNIHSTVLNDYIVKQ